MQIIIALNKEKFKIVRLKYLPTLHFPMPKSF